MHVQLHSFSEERPVAERHYISGTQTRPASARERKCTKTLITAPIAQINGGKAMTPGLSDDVSNSVIATDDFLIPNFCFLLLFGLLSNLIDSAQNSVEIC